MSQDINTKEIYECEECKEKDAKIAELERQVTFWEKSSEEWKGGYERLQQELTELKKENKGLEENIEALKYNYVLKDIPKEERCEECGGRGEKAYGNTSTYNHGIGGQMITEGVCDKCWGSGKKYEPWKSWKEINNMKKELEALKQSQGKVLSAEEIITIMKDVRDERKEFDDWIMLEDEMIARAIHKAQKGDI